MHAGSKFFSVATELIKEKRILGKQNETIKYVINY
jgi:hypothetical protein